MSTCEIRTFGGLEVVLNGAPISRFTARSAEAVLVYVALANLRNALHRLRRALTDQLDVSRGSVAA